MDTALAHLVTSNDPALKIIYESIDEDYMQCIRDIEQNTKTSHLAEQLKNIKSDISIHEGLLMIDAKRIILPKKCDKTNHGKAPCWPRWPGKDNKVGAATILLAEPVE